MGRRGAAGFSCTRYVLGSWGPALLLGPPGSLVRQPTAELGGLELALLQEGDQASPPVDSGGNRTVPGAPELFPPGIVGTSRVHPHGYIHALQTFLLFPLAEKFLQNQHLSYGQPLTLLLGAEGNGTGTESRVPQLRVQLVLEGEGMEVTIVSSESQPRDGKQAVTFRYLLWCFGDSRVT